MPLPRYRIFSPTDSAAMSRLEFRARQVVEGVISGMHKSPHRGFSVEFSEHRKYVAGDEIRHLDWRAYARSDRYYVKLYEQETNLRATLVLDTSASMAYAGKLEYAKHLAACLAYLLSLQQDLSGLAAIDEQVRVEIPPGSSAPHLDRLFRALDNIVPSGLTELPKQLRLLSERLPRRSLIILLSDCWTEPLELVRALQHAKYRRHDVMLLHLLDRAEVELSFDKKITLRDMETNEEMQVDPADIREAYSKQVQEHLASVRRACGDCDAEYHALYVDEPYDKALIRLMTRRNV